MWGIGTAVFEHVQNPGWQDLGVEPRGEVPLAARDVVGVIRLRFVHPDGTHPVFAVAVVPVLERSVHARRVRRVN